MKVFMTSATGHVGSAVADALVSAGHTVSALARSGERTQQLKARGITPRLGDLGNPSSYCQWAASHDVILHTAYEYHADGNERPEIDETAVEAMLNAAVQSSSVRHFVYTSSVFLLGGIERDPLDEETPPEAALGPSRRRLAVESRVLAASSKRLTTAVIRLGVVYGANSYSMSELFEAAEHHGSTHYYGSGRERWPLIYRGDMASLFRAVVERSGAGIFHAVDGLPMTTARIAELTSLAAGCGGRTHRAGDAASGEIHAEHYDRVARDVPAVSTRGAVVGWAPSVPSFDVGAAVAFREWRSHAARETQT